MLNFVPLWKSLSTTPTWIGWKLIPGFDAALPQEVVSAFRRRMAIIRAAPDERVFRNSKGLHYEKLKGRREGERSMRLNRQFRLILRIDDRDGRKIVVILAVEDYH